MWDRFDLWLFSQIKNYLNNQFPLTKDPIGLFIYAICFLSIIGQGIVVILNKNKGGKRK